MGDSVARIKLLIEQAKQAREYHMARGRLGMIEALGAQIRLNALKEALAAMEGQAE